MAEAVLNLHSGGHLVNYDDLKSVHASGPSGRWHPVAHATVLDTVVGTLTGAGYAVKNQSLALARDGQQLFGTIDLATNLSDGFSLAVGIRNSTDKSFPLAFAAGSRVFVCSNIAFTEELLVKRKHTRLAVGRWDNEIGGAIQKLPSFAAAEETRIAALKARDLTDDQALAFLVRAMEKHVISAPVIPKVLAEYRNPRHDYGTGDRFTAWRLLNRLATVLVRNDMNNPAEYTGQTIRLNALLAAEPATAA